MENKTPIQQIIKELRSKVSDNPSNPFYSAFGMAAIICEKYLEKEKSEIIQSFDHAEIMNGEFFQTCDNGEDYYNYKFK